MYMNITFSKYELFGNNKKNKEDFQEILKMIQYTLIKKEKGIYNSDIYLYKSNGINRYVLYIETTKLEENLLFEINEYYFKKFMIPKKNADIFLVVNIEKENELTDYFLDCFMILPNRNNNMLKKVPIIINRAENKLCVGNSSNYPAMLRENFNSLYNEIQNDIKSFMNLYYMKNKCDIADYYEEVPIRMNTDKKKEYKKFSQKGYIINKFNIEEFKFQKNIEDLVKYLIMLMLTYIFYKFSFNEIFRIFSEFLNIILLFYTFAFILKSYLKVTSLIKCKKIKLESFENLNNRITEGLLKEKYSRISNNIYEKKHKKFILAQNEYNIPESFDKSTIILFEKKYNVNKVKKMSKNATVLVLSENDRYVYIYKNNSSKIMYELTKIFSHLYDIH